MTRALMVLVMATAVMSGTTTVLGQATTDSATWEFKYEGDVLPPANTPAMTEFNYTYANSTFSNTVGGGVLTLLTNAGSEPNTGNGYKSVSNFLSNASVGSSIEFRVRLVSGSGIGVKHRGASSDFGMSINSDNTITCGSGGGCQPPPDTVPLPNGVVASDWHIYRSTRDGGTGIINFYIDNDPTPILGPLTGANAGTAIAFQLFGGPGEAKVDYFRATNMGAFPSIPEPATLGLMSLGGLLALRRRRSA